MYTLKIISKIFILKILFRKLMHVVKIRCFTFSSYSYVSLASISFDMAVQKAIKTRIKRGMAHVPKYPPKLM